MINAVLGKKIDQTQRFTGQGKRVPVTLIKAGPCPVVQMKTEDHDGYWAVQLGFGQRKEKRTTKPILEHLKKAGLTKIPRFLREVRVEKKMMEKLTNKIKLGTEITVGDVFKVGDKVSVTGVSKGKGFAGVVKRWGFAGGPRTHGQSDRERALGSPGAETPARVLRGKKMPGRMGGKRTTVKGLKVIEIDKEKNLLVVKGLVPGAKGGLLLISRQQKRAKRVS